MIKHPNMKFRTLTLQLFFTLLLNLCTQPARSCSCAGPYDTVFCAAVAPNTHIFYGKVLERTHPSYMRVAVLENIYRPIALDTIIMMGQDGVNCGENLDRLSAGTEYVLALYDEPINGQDTFLLGGCSQNFYPVESGLVRGHIVPGLTDMSYETLRDNITDILDCRLPGRFFLSENNRWNLLFGGINFINGNINMYTEIFEFRDTILHNGRIYKRLWSTRDSLLTGFEPMGVGFREEAGGKIYRYQQGLAEEELVYDFSLEPGDEVIFGGFPFYFVRAVDSVQLADGSQRRRLEVVLNAAPSSDGVFWIEGLGSEINTFFPEGSFIIDGYAHLLCFYQNEELLHSTELANGPEGCYQALVTTEEESKALTWNLFPNPVSDLLNIRFGQPTTHALHLRLRNHLGQVVGEWPLPAHTERASWEMDGLPPGLYFVELRMNGKLVGKEKLLICDL